MAGVATRGAGPGRVRPWGSCGGEIRDNRGPGLVHHGGHAARAGPRSPLNPIPAGARMYASPPLASRLLQRLARLGGSCPPALSRTARWLGIAGLSAALLAGPARAQSFGKNKVQYEQLQW